MIIIIIVGKLMFKKAANYICFLKSVLQKFAPIFAE